ncbi:unnamed protein product, partial [Rotaria sp. Silwood1]
SRRVFRCVDDSNLNELALVLENKTNRISSRFYLMPNFSNNLYNCYKKKYAH